jgi:hypothetical protein
MLKSVFAALMLALPGLVVAQEASASRPAITGISHVTLFADDLAQSQQFYGELLGWYQVPSNGANSGMRFYANHSQYVELLSPPSQGLANRLDRVAFRPATQRRCAGISAPTAFPFRRRLPWVRMEAEAFWSTIRKGTRSSSRRRVSIRPLNRLQHRKV